MPTLLFVVILNFAAANANKEHFCGGDDWAPFTEAKCIRLFALAGAQSHKEAGKICALENGARLVTVQSPAEQAALEHYLSTQKKANSSVMTEDLWLGGSDELYDQYHLPQYNSSSFTWDRDSNQKKAPLTFTNWALDQPKKPWSKFENTCIKLHADCGKWSNELCARRHLVICEKPKAGLCKSCSRYSWI
ncbi:hypothetical protein TYRP_023441 [Tyrophagus putrescentiae]|nr:hypothetical protein TYRP_023441 [Tyrophagus putrescentiae]